VQQEAAISLIADWQFVTLATAKIYENTNLPVVLCSRVNCNVTRRQ